MNNQEMTQSHYSLRWNNHQSHILAAFDALLQAETLVDVTLVCAETSVRAHKVVLSACSPFFQRIFSENPCKHPVIVLKDFSGWEVQAIVDFMYKGEISVIQAQLQSLIKAAESLQVRGLANQDPFGVVKDTNITNRNTPNGSPSEYDRNFYNQNRFPTPGTPARSSTERLSPSMLGSPFSPISSNYEPTAKMPHMSRLSFPDSLLTRQDCQSPIPRRKQARPRRRSGEICGVQDLSTNIPKPSPNDDIAENLSMKKNGDKPHHHKIEDCSKDLTPDSSITPELDISSKEYRTSPGTLPPPSVSMKHELENHSPLSFPPMPSVSALTMTQPHNKFFGLDSPLGMFPPTLDACRNPLFDIPDHRAPDPQMFVKKKMGRPKGQHSAPRGGPPRSWTNAELTEALQHVWNKKMTTSQASRIFGIPYNSLLMYVRGKYGKSLKLEQLRKDCTAGPQPGPGDLLAMGQVNNNNNLCKTERENEPINPNTRPSSTEEQQHQQLQHQHFISPFMHNFYPDFATGFPIPVNMIHLLPPSEKTRDHYQSQQTEVLDCKKEMLDDEQEMFKPPTLSVDDRRELVQHNGQD